MPELPEVETIRRDLKKKILNKKISALDITKKARVNLDHAKFKKYLSGKKFVDIDRIGKLLIFDINVKDKFLLVHLKMTGQLIYQKDNKVIGGGHSERQVNLDLPNKSTRLTFKFSDRGKLFFNDMRRFGYLKIVDFEELEKVKTNFGIEPLTTNFTLSNFRKVFKNRKTNIKAILLNQKLISGIGNIYADEACFLAGVRPDKSVTKLTAEEIKKLYQAIQKVITKAITERGTTFNNYLDSDGKQGNFLKFLKVYGRGGLKCMRCGNILKKTKIAGRGTVFCSGCQK